MDQSLQKYYDDQFEMFNTEGWKQFKEDAVKELANYQEQADLVCTTNDTWQYSRGMMNKLRMLAGYEEFTKMSYEDVLNSELEDEEDKD